METRNITEVKIYKLVLNPMRGNTENSVLVAIAYDKVKLAQWYNDQIATENYVDVGEPSFACHGDSHHWHKTFKQGGHLEWYNPCSNLEEPDHYGHGIQWEWTTQESIDSFININGSQTLLIS